MKNTNYAPEMYRANNFIIEHNTDADLMAFLRKMENENLSHSDRWSQIYDYMEEHYPAATGSLITGLTYWVES